MKKLVNCLLLTISLLIAGVSQAGVVSGSGVIAGEQFDWYEFTTTGRGRVNIGTTETTKPASGIWDQAYATVLFLFSDDGALDDANYLGKGSTNESDNGDSFISQVLNAGKYLLAVATHGANANPLPIAGGHLTHSHTDYSLSISGDFVTGNPPSNQVPEPGSLALFGLGLIGLAALSKRKQT